MSPVLPSEHRGSRITVRETLTTPRTRDRIARTLAVDILSGRYPEGETLPKEEELSKRFDVSRTVLREAMRTLAAKGMVIAKPRAGTIVATMDRWNQLDRQVMEWRDEVAPDLAFVIGLMEVRRLIEPAAASFAAERSTSQDLARIEAGFLRMQQAVGQELEEWLSADQEFHLAIIHATQNPVFRALGTIISSSLRNSFKLMVDVSDNFLETLDLHGEVLEAIRMRQSEVAAAKMSVLLDVAQSDIRRAEVLEQGSRPRSWPGTGRDRKDE